MIIETVSIHSFRDSFRAYNRTENFSYESLGALFEYLEDMSEDCDVPYELDVIGLCCEFSEIYLEDVSALYDLGEELTNEEALEWLQERTTVIETSSVGLVVISEF